MIEDDVHPIDWLRVYLYGTRGSSHKQTRILLSLEAHTSALSVCRLLELPRKEGVASQTLTPLRHEGNDVDRFDREQSHLELTIKGDSARAYSERKEK